MEQRQKVVRVYIYFDYKGQGPLLPLRVLYSMVEETWTKARHVHRPLYYWILLTNATGGGRLPYADALDECDWALATFLFDAFDEYNSTLLPCSANQHRTPTTTKTINISQRIRRKRLLQQFKSQVMKSVREHMFICLLTGGDNFGTNLGGSVSSTRC